MCAPEPAARSLRRGARPRPRGRPPRPPLLPALGLAAAACARGAAFLPAPRAVRARLGGAEVGSRPGPRLLARPRAAAEPAARSSGGAGAAGAAAAAVAVLALAGAAPASAAQAAAAAAPADFGAVWAKAAGSATKGGVAGLLAGVAQVLSFMWLRTSMNYQYFNGGNLQSALETLWKEGGIARLYQGLSLALVQAPLSRFGDTAANAGVLVLMDFYMPDAPLALKTGAASTAAAAWRLFLTPIDTLKTVRQVQGDKATDILMARVKERGLGELYAGAVAIFAANWLGNFPYFFVFNSLSEAFPAPADTPARIVRNGLLGMCSSVCSDVCSNSLRVLKTLRQSSRDADKGYLEVAKDVIDKDGVAGLLGRGLETRLLVNILQGTFFTIIWKLIEDSLNSQ